MRTTIDIDDDVLLAVQEIARREKSSAGRVITRLARQALTGAVAHVADQGTRFEQAPASGQAPGFRPFASRGQPVTNADIDRIRDAEGA